MFSVSQVVSKQGSRRMLNLAQNTTMGGVGGWEGGFAFGVVACQGTEGLYHHQGPTIYQGLTLTGAVWTVSSREPTWRWGLTTN